MREILFRAKRKSNGKWIEGYIYKQIVNLNDEYYIRRGDTDYLVVPETVGQFTGLTDKNGKKIFEGDIVRRFNIRGLEVMRYAVKWNTDCCMFALACEDTYLGEYDSDFTVFYGEEFEIVGNVHDNPELLKEE